MDNDTGVFHGLIEYITKTDTYLLPRGEKVFSPPRILNQIKKQKKDKQNKKAFIT